MRLFIIQTLLLAIPAFCANIIPVFVCKIKGLSKFNLPIDNYKKYRGYRILGDNKTWRGLISGTIIGGVLGVVLYAVSLFDLGLFNSISSLIDFFVFGVLSGFGALFGDAIMSFFKRQFGIKSGEAWIPFDYIDYILGMYLFTFFLGVWTINNIGFLLVFVLIANPITNLIGYLIGVKKSIL